MSGLGTSPAIDVNVAELLRDMLFIPSVSGEEHALAEFLVQRMTSLGMRASVDDAGNAIGVREAPGAAGDIAGDAPTREVMLLGHMDTVPGWIDVRVEDNRLYGRGSVDAKGALATFIAAAATAKLSPGARIIVAGAVEEEIATSRGARHIARTFSPDMCIIGEPSGSDGVVLGYKGRMLIEASFEQPCGHSAGPATSVAERACDWWQALRAMCDAFNAQRSRLFDQLLPSLLSMQTHSDGLADSVTLRVSLRLPPETDFEQLRSELFAIDARASLAFSGFEQAFESSRSSPLARAFIGAMRTVLDMTPRFKLKTGTSDMNVVGPVWRCPIVAYGPGDSTLDHTPHEHVELAELDRAVAVLREVLQCV